MQFGVVGNSIGHIGSLLTFWRFTNLIIIIISTKLLYTWPGQYLDG